MLWAVMLGRLPQTTPDRSPQALPLHWPALHMPPSRFNSFYVVLVIALALSQTYNAQAELTGASIFLDSPSALSIASYGFQAGGFAALNLSSSVRNILRALFSYQTHHKPRSVPITNHIVFFDFYRQCLSFPTYSGVKQYDRKIGIFGCKEKATYAVRSAQEAVSFCLLKQRPIIYRHAY